MLLGHLKKSMGCLWQTDNVGVTLSQQVPVVVDNVVQTIIVGMESHDQYGFVHVTLCDTGRVKESVSVGPSSLYSSSLNVFDGVVPLL